MKRNYDVGIREAKCSRCGKIYIQQPYHVYKHNKKYFCGWTCYNAYLNEIDSKKGGRR